MTNQMFTPIRLGAVEMANRTVVSPMCQYSASDGVPNDWHLMHLGQFAVAGFGMVMAEATGVEPEGRITHGCLGLWNDEQEAAFARIVAFVKQYGAARPAIQLAHAGRKASTQLMWLGGKPLGEGEAPWQTCAPSAVPFDEGWHVPVEMTRADMDRVRDAFVAAAKRAERAGFEIVELHGAHGYLISQFLSPIANHRGDDYGGSLENRMRFPLEGFDAVRAALPDTIPLGMRLSATDYEEPGITLDETVMVAQALKDRGCDFIDVSSGGNLATRPPVANLGPGYQVPFAEKIKAETGIATMAVGMIRDPHLAEDIIASGKADMVALARGALYDPHWVWHAAEALGEDMRYVDQYGRCHPKTWPAAFASTDKAAAD